MKTNTCAILMLINDRKHNSFLCFHQTIQCICGWLRNMTTKGFISRIQRFVLKSRQYWTLRCIMHNWYINSICETSANNSIWAGGQFIFITKNFASTLSINVANVSKNWCADVVLQTLHQNIILTGAFSGILGCINMHTWPDPIWIFSMH